MIQPVPALLGSAVLRRLRALSGVRKYRKKALPGEGHAVHWGGLRENGIRSPVKAAILSPPSTENGFIRVLTNPSYPGRRTTVVDAAERLARFISPGHHTFWADELSLLDNRTFSLPRLSGHKEITDTYLLGLAVRNGGRLVTFDRGLRPDAVRGAGSEHLTVL